MSDRFAFERQTMEAAIAEYNSRCSDELKIRIVWGARSKDLEPQIEAMDAVAALLNYAGEDFEICIVRFGDGTNEIDERNIIQLSCAFDALYAWPTDGKKMNDVCLSLWPMEGLLSQPNGISGVQSTLPMKSLTRITLEHMLMCLVLSKTRIAKVLE